ncbi:nucleoside phosphorylase [Chlorogloeopsis sp. ULAP01]|uniref:phosphorylase family protein n=1 Tax=Chlorogloeopsis sp. ULAP01 TaxID=3056483 RepID=UPI0025AB546B|nr:nucleoside phosphorylase [Chlorogloeopsis sp. ULAP01]MDM9384806.1 nucleoside phosphorylase [Chlorogloeopsis sp. ULAP01]
MPHQTSIQAILVCQGVEYQAVCRGLRRVPSSTTSVIPIPVGGNANSRFLPKSQYLQEILNHPQPRVLVMGLCGSLTPKYKVGEIVLYQNNIYQENTNSSLQQKSCDRTFTCELDLLFQKKVPLVTALTSDRVICSANEKRHLHQTLNAEVVDMEGFAILEFFEQTGVSVAMLRVVSDGCDRDITNLNLALSLDGSLQPLAFAVAMLKQPIAATRLIRGSLQALKVLEEVTTFLFQDKMLQT